MSSLFPDGITSLYDLPYTLHQAITMGLQFLEFMEMPKDERPARRIWLDAEELRKHFEAVEKRREEKYGGKKEIEDPVQNDAASMLVAD